MNVRRSVTVAVVLALTLALTSCGVNFNAQTDQVYNPGAGTNDRESTVDVLNALVVSGEDGSGTVVATLVNNDTAEDDTLIAVEDPSGRTKVDVTGPTTIPAAGLLNLADSGGVTATGERIVPGVFVEITWTFQRGEPVTFSAPVVSADDPTYADVPLPQSPRSPSL